MMVLRAKGSNGMGMYTFSNVILHNGGEPFRMPEEIVVNGEKPVQTHKTKVKK